MKIAVHYRCATQLPERRLTGTPTVLAKMHFINNMNNWNIEQYSQVIIALLVLVGNC